MTHEQLLAYYGESMRLCMIYRKLADLDMTKEGHEVERNMLLFDERSWGIPPERVDHDAWFRGYNDGKAGARPPKTTKASGPGTPRVPKAACLAVKRFEQ